MKLSLIIIFVTLIQVCWSAEKPITFHHSELKVPDNFERLPSASLENYKSIFKKEIMDVYYESIKDESELVARLMIYYDSLSSIKNMKFEKAAKMKLEVMEEIGARFFNMKTDAIKHLVYGTAVMQGDTVLFGFSVNKHGILNLSYDLKEGESPEVELLKFKKIMYSIVHDFPYEYEVFETPEMVSTKKEMESSGMAMTIGFIAMIAVWAFRKFLLNGPKEE